MMPPLVYASGIQQSLAEDTAKTLGTTANSKQEFNHLPHLYYQKLDYRFFTQKQDQLINFE